MAGVHLGSGVELAAHLAVDRRLGQHRPQGARGALRDRVPDDEHAGIAGAGRLVEAPVAPRQVVGNLLGDRPLVRLLLPGGSRDGRVRVARGPGGVGPGIGLGRRRGPAAPGLIAALRELRAELDGAPLRDRLPVDGGEGEARDRDRARTGEREGDAERAGARPSSRASRPVRPAPAAPARRLARRPGRAPRPVRAPRLRRHPGARSGFYRHPAACGCLGGRPSGEPRAGGLDQAVEHLGRDERHEDLGGLLPPGGGGRAHRGVHEDEQRVVDEVEGERARAQPGERGQGQEPPQQAPGDLGAREREPRRGGGEQVAAAVHERALPVREREAREQRRQPEGARRGQGAQRERERSALADGPPPPRPQAVERERGERADRELGQARVRPVVDARRVARRVEQQCHERGGEGGQDGACGDGRPAGAQRPVRGHDDGGPHEVELHRHGEVPQVGERGGEARRGEVGDLAEDVGPVDEEQGARERVRLHLGQQAGARKIGPQRGERDRREHRGQQAREPPGEVAPVGERTSPRDAPLDGAGREVARDDEEDRDAQEAPGQRRGAQVVEHHARDGDGAQAVDGPDAPLGPVHSESPFDRGKCSTRPGRRPGGRATGPVRAPAATVT